MVVDALRRHQLAAFWSLAFAFSWAYWIPLAVWAPDRTHFPGLLGPLVAGLAVTAATAGRPGLADLGRRLLRWRLPGRLWLLALLPLAAAGAGILVRGAVTGSWPSRSALLTLDGLPRSGLLSLVVLVLVVNGFGEEVGWRGVAWPRLRERHGIAAAAGLLAAPWALWHLPTFWLDTGLRGFPLLTVPGWLIGLTAGCVVLGWLYETGRSSLLLVAAFHSSLNLGSATAATEGLPAAAAAASVIAVAVCVLRSPAAARPLPASGRLQSPCARSSGDRAGAF